MIDLTRREFLRTAPALLLAPTLLSTRSATPVHVVLVYAPEFERAVRAARMSAAEAARAAALLGREFSFAAVPVAEAAALDRAATALITATRAPVTAPDITTVDIAGSMPCAANVFKLRSTVAGAHVWHESLERYGAAQLNDRFRAAGIAPIDDQAWLGWFAVKLLWEAGARGRSPRELGFDGHKGVPLRFNQAGVLMQPLYVLDAAGKRVLEEQQPDAAAEAAPCVS